MFLLKNTIRTACGLLTFSLLLLPLAASAVTNRPATVIDDFEDGDFSGWAFFPGAGASGGGLVLDDRPREGNYYLSTTWSGQGTGSGLYGGVFNNFANSAQIVPPADPWLNFWVLNQSNASVDSFRMVITLREDLNGDGWTAGLEDSIEHRVTFDASEFDDQWRLISLPLGSFLDIGPDGDGIFNGNLDEIAVVLDEIQGVTASTIELDFDQFSFTSGGPVSSPLTLFDDMEHGNPSANGWSKFNSNISNGGIDPNSIDLPPVDGGVFSLQAGWGSGGTPGYLGGFGRSNPVDLSQTAYFNFWINPDPGQDYSLDIRLRDDDDGNDTHEALDDDEFSYVCAVSAAGPCAVSGGGWQLVSIPLDAFFDWNPAAGNGILDAIPVSAGGNGQLLETLFTIVSNSGADVTFRTDYWIFSDTPLGAVANVIDDFENGLPQALDGNATVIGFDAFSDGSPISAVTTSAPPAPLPDAAANNDVLALSGNVVAFAGVVHRFENAAADTWVTQDWSSSEGISFWFYGQNTGTALYLDVLDNRNPGSTTDDAERFVTGFVDDFSGWQRFEFPFAGFARKEIGNGAPNDGFSLNQVHGWALGMLNTPGEVTYYIDDVALYGAVAPPPLTVGFTQGRFGIDEGGSGNITVKLSRPLKPTDPAQVSVDYATGAATAVPDRDYTPTSGTLTFVNGGPAELGFPLQTFSDNKWQGDRHVNLVLDNLVDVAPAVLLKAHALVIDDEVPDTSLLDDFERGPELMSAASGVVLSTPQVARDAPQAVPGQQAYEGILQIDGAPLIEVAIDRKQCKKESKRVSKKKRKKGRYLVPITLFTSDDFDALAVDLDTISLGNGGSKRTKIAKRKKKDVDKDGDLDLVLYVRADKAGLKCKSKNLQLSGYTRDKQRFSSARQSTRFGRDFAIDQDWSHGEALSFWYYGNGDGAPVTVRIKDNRAPDPGPAGWSLAWSDEFDDPAGSLPDPATWSYEIGDLGSGGIIGWGNAELQYYTDDPANASTDGNGNLSITVRAADTARTCWYGPCEYTSARLTSKHKAEFAYGRIETRLQVPPGVGLWPAFWGLGTDIDEVYWPQTGEIDIMEFVGRIPNEIFGTIHGPGYSGGASYGGIYDFGRPVSDEFHTFAIEWEPDRISWYVDGILYHQAEPADVAPNEWVFNDPIFLILNIAIGGNFGGAIDPNLVLPKSMLVDYIRVYQAPDTAERFETSFVDDVAGWRQLVLPFSGFTRSAEQPDGAPNDGLGLNDTWGYEFYLPEGGSVLLDQVRLQSAAPPASITVTSLDDSGAGSLRQALLDIADDGSIGFDSSLTGGTLTLGSGELVLGRNVTIDGAGAPGLALSGADAFRVLQIAPGADVTIRDLVIADGAGSQVGGAILNFGRLTLERSVVRDNRVDSPVATSFDLGGGGIYNGDGARLDLTDSTVSDNNSANQPGGGIYGYFNSTINITRSTVSGNVSLDVGGGLRSLGDVTISNSTLSGNVSTAWHGGAIFQTDGQLTVTHSTISANAAPPGTAAGVVIAKFGGSSTPSLTLTRSILANPVDGVNCAIVGAASITSGGNNLADDASCNLVAAGDQPSTAAQLGPLADNGGPTLTHMPGASSPAIGTAGNTGCPTTDQRGVARPQGAACDIGAVENDVPP